jgi:MYXO-CTERM domain-containing protein
VFGNIGNIQVGVSVSAALAGLDQEISFDIDQVSVVPEPTAAALAVMAMLGLWVGARQRR